MSLTALQNLLADHINHQSRPISRPALLKFCASHHYGAEMAGTALDMLETRGVITTWAEGGQSFVQMEGPK